MMAEPRGSAPRIIKPSTNSGSRDRHGAADMVVFQPQVETSVDPSPQPSPLKLMKGEIRAFRDSSIGQSRNYTDETGVGGPNGRSVQVKSVLNVSRKLE